MEVAPREGSVDRNRGRHGEAQRVLVAPREGSVDRNDDVLPSIRKHGVAPREGSVDRNLWGVRVILVFDRRSPRGERG